MKEYKNINNIIYKLHLFWIPRLIVWGMIGPFLFSVLCMIPLVIFDMELVGNPGIVILGTLVFAAFLIGVGVGIMSRICRRWKKENHIEQIVAKAVEYGIYTGGDYLNEIEQDLNRGYAYAKNYLGISNNYIYGIELNNQANSFMPVVIPRNRIVGIAYDMSSHNALVAGSGIHITKFLDGGYNVYLDNGKTVVIAYGYKFGIPKGVEAIRKAGFNVGRVDRQVRGF